MPAANAQDGAPGEGFPVSSQRPHPPRAYLSPHPSAPGVRELSGVVSAQ